MRLDLHRRQHTAPAPAAARPPADRSAEPRCADLDAELRELLLAEYAQPALIVLPGAAFLVRPVRRRMW
jgi:hypothetical protein